MAVPTITAISPAAGHSGGRVFVEIDGTNFRTPTPQAPGPNGITPVAPPSVAVYFAGVKARAVRWLSPTLLYAATPPGDPGPCEVTVQNIDDSGNPIPGEAVTLPGGYSYLLPQLTADAESDLARLVRTFIELLQQQITPNVAWPKSTDYDTQTGALIAQAVLPQMPGLVIAEVELVDNPFYANRGPTSITDEGGGAFVVQSPPPCVDIVFTIAGITNNSVELQNLAAATKRFFWKNVYIVMDRAADDPDKGAVQWEMDAIEDKSLKLTITSSASNVRHFVMQALIRGFDIEAMSGLPTSPGIGQSEAIQDFGWTSDGTVTINPTRPIGGGG